MSPIERTINSHMSDLIATGKQDLFPSCIIPTGDRAVAVHSGVVAVPASARTHIDETSNCSCPPGRSGLPLHCCHGEEHSRSRPVPFRPVWFGALVNYNFTHYGS